jgi:hypothetical protein
VGHTKTEGIKKTGPGDKTPGPIFIQPTTKPKKSREPSIFKFDFFPQITQITQIKDHFCGGAAPAHVLNQNVVLYFFTPFIITKASSF